MKQTLFIALLLISSSTFAQLAEQPRRPAYQGYGVPGATPSPSTDADFDAKVAVDSPTERVQLELDAKLRAELPAAAELPVDSTAENTDSDGTADASTEFASEDPQTEIPLAIIESIPVEPAPDGPPRVLVAPPATLQLDANQNLQSVIAPADDITNEFTVPVVAEPVAVKLSPARWQLDVVVFRASGPQALRAERWERNPGRPDIERFDVITDSSADSLREVIGRLDASPAHQPLLQRTLMFDQLPDFLRTRGAAFETTQAIIDANLVRGHSTMPTPASRFDWPEILGTVKLTQGVALSVSVDLLFTYPTALPYRADDSEDPFLEGGFELPANEKLYQLGHIRLQQTANANAGKLLYFDNPAIGAIVNITELVPQPVEPIPPMFVDIKPESPESGELTADDFDDSSESGNSEISEADEGEIIDAFEVEGASESTGESTGEPSREATSVMDNETDTPIPTESMPTAEPIVQPENTYPVDPAGP